MTTIHASQVIENYQQKEKIASRLTEPLRSEKNITEKASLHYFYQIHETTNPDEAVSSEATNYPVSISISKDSDDTVVSEVEEQQEQLLEVTAINIYNPRADYLEDFIATGLRDTLTNNFLDSVSYKLPHNKKVKSKTHIRHGNIGILKFLQPVFQYIGTYINLPLNINALTGLAAGFAPVPNY